MTMDRCSACGAPDTELWSGWFGPDDLASDGHGKSDRWTTWCNVCGAEQDAPPPIKVRKPRAKKAVRPAARPVCAECGCYRDASHTCARGDECRTCQAPEVEQPERQRDSATGRYVKRAAS